MARPNVGRPAKSAANLPTVTPEIFGLRILGELINYSTTSNGRVALDQALLLAPYQRWQLRHPSASHSQSSVLIILLRRHSQLSKAQNYSYYSSQVSEECKSLMESTCS